MEGEIINTLQELVVGVCDELYANRQLITNTSVKKAVILHGLWSEDELEAEIPAYINEWRLSNLSSDKGRDELLTLREELLHAKNKIQILNKELTSLRLDVVSNLRGLLNGA